MNAAPTIQDLPLRRRLLLGALSLVIATAVWMPLLHLGFVPGSGEFRALTGISPTARALARRHLDLWDGSGAGRRDIAAMRVSNPEWDFMGRTYLVLSLANMALREPRLDAQCLLVMDRIIEDTENLLSEKGEYHFLMNYARYGSFVQQPARSMFIDGEVALMMGARRMIEENAGYRERMRRLVDLTLELNIYSEKCWPSK